MKTILKTLIIISALTFISCKKDKTLPPEPLPNNQNNSTSGSLKIEFEAMVGDSSLVFSTSTYTNQTGNTFNVTMFKYYISNIKLIKEDNSTWSETYSYHLIDHSNTLSTTITLNNVPFANYKGIEFTIGVDSTHNVSGSQSGALDPIYDMFWSWNTGYIMAKFEGNSPQSTAANNKLMYHIGGFSGNNNAVKIVSPDFNGDLANVTSSITPEIHMKSDLIKWFGTQTTIDFSILNTVHMPGTNAKNIASNYTSMFTVEHIHN
jgi:hypothetical protein